jgi:branched-chain amino acid transport system substrate-binding protein
VVMVRIVFIAAAVLAIGLMPNAGSRGAAQSLAPYELTAILALTGPIAFGGKEQQQTLQVIESVVNQTGGIQHHPLKINFLDDQSNLQVAVQIVSGLITKGVPVMLGPIFTASCAAVAPLIEKNGPVSFCFTPGYSPSKDGFVFSPGASTFDQIQAYLKFYRDQHWNRIAVLTTTDATGQAAVKALETNMAAPENKSVTLVAMESMGVTDLSASAQIQRIKAARPDVIFFTGSGPPYGTMLRALVDAGLDIPTASSTANMSYNSMQQYKDVLPKTTMFAGLRGLAISTTPKGPIRDAQSLYYRSFKAASLRPNGINLTPWDPTWIVISALRKYGVNATSTQIHNYIQNLHGWVGINGVYDFSNGNQRGVSDNGVAVYAWNRAQADFVPISGPGGSALKK